MNQGRAAPGKYGSLSFMSEKMLKKWRLLFHREARNLGIAARFIDGASRSAWFAQGAGSDWRGGAKFCRHHDSERRYGETDLLE